jgi:hypothetical protein
MIAKCGKHNIWHWAHKTRENCDPWWEPETQWHRDWKDRFPEAWHEVSHIDSTSGEVHIADVQTIHGLVVEFQHSRITEEELKSREAFYGNMIWIVDGSPSRLGMGLFDLGEPASQPTRRATNNQTPSGQSSLFDLFEDVPAPAPGPPISKLPNTQSTEFEEDWRFYWYGRGKFFHDWVQAAKPVYIDLGDDTIWLLKSFDTVNAWGIVRRLFKHILIDNIIRNQPINSS